MNNATDAEYKSHASNDDFKKKCNKGIPNEHFG